MTTPDRVSGLVLLLFCIAYGVMSYDIELYPGSEEEPFTARTLPLLLAWAGAVLAMLTIVMPSKDVPEQPLWRGGHWIQIGLLCVAMVGYGLTIKSVSFLLATVAFLILGFVILGERRWSVLLFVPLPVAACFQFVLHGLLDIYIEDPLLLRLGVIE